MTDRHDEDTENLPGMAAEPLPTRGEGVRIIGAEEAKAVLDAGAVGRPLDDGEVDQAGDPGQADAGAEPDRRPDRSSAAAASELGDEPTAEHPAVVDEIGAAFDDSSDDGSAIDDDVFAQLVELDDAAESEAEVGAVDEPLSPPVGLPHWSEPATGEVPVIRSELDDDLSDEDLVAGPRYRSDVGGWSDDDLETLASLGDAADEEPATVVRAGAVPEDDDSAFDQAVAARRVRPRPSRPRPAHPEPPKSGDDFDLGGDRNETMVRVVTGVGIAALALVCLSAGRAATVVLATAIVGVCTFELYQALHQRGFRPAAIIGLLGAITIVPLAYNRGEFAFPFVFAMVTVFTLLWFVFEVVHTRPMVNVAVTIGGFAYIGGLGAFAGLLLLSDNGVGLILGVAIPVIAYDVCGFFVGSQFGKSRLAPHISPNKTVEGLIGGMAGSIIAAVVIVKLIHPWGGLGHAFALGLTVAVMAPLGDLAESMLKRDLGIKDFGALLPGHGGVLDRFDAILFCLPAVYFLTRALKIG